MKLIEVITSKENLNRAYKKVVANKGASGWNYFHFSDNKINYFNNKVAKLYQKYSP